VAHRREIVNQTSAKLAALRASRGTRTAFHRNLCDHY